MATLWNALRWQFPEIDPRADVQIKEDGGGPVIVFWNVAKLGPQPSAQQIATWADPSNDAVIAAAAADADRTQIINAMATENRGLVVSVLYNIDQRLRVLEARPAINLATFKVGLKSFI